MKNMRLESVLAVFIKDPNPGTSTGVEDIPSRAFKGLTLCYSSLLSCGLFCFVSTLARACMADCLIHLLFAPPCLTFLLEILVTGKPQVLGTCFHEAGLSDSCCSPCLFSCHCLKYISAVYEK